MSNHHSDGHGHAEDGNFVLHLFGTPQGTYRLEGSSNFVLWEVLATNLLDASGRVRIEDGTPGSSRFYRGALHGPAP